MELSEGTVIQNKYRITRLLGQGGMGAVYEGENAAIARRVAIKVLHAEVASQHGVVERFEREAQAAGRIGNDHILEVLDLGSLDDGSRFIVMEFLDGETLEERAERRGRLSPAEVYPLVRQVLIALDAAHASNIIHRDLKPDNVFISKHKAGQEDFVKLIDFGISKFVDADSDLRMTATGAVMGTPYYMAPEQARGSKDADHRTDIYALGVIMYRCVTGQVPFAADNFNELLFAIVLKTPPPPREHEPTLDPAFESLILKAMARDPNERFANAREFMAALDRWAQAGTGVSAPTIAGAPPSDSSAPAFRGLMTDVPAIPDRTGPGWTNSTLDIPKRSRTPAFLAAGTVGALALLGIALAVSNDGADDVEPTIASSALPPAVSSAASSALPPVTVSAEAPAPNPSAALNPDAPNPSASAPTPEPPPSTEPTADEPEAAPTVDRARRASQPRRPAATPVRRRTAAPRTRPQVETPRPAPEPARPSGDGDTDFGY